MWGPSREAEYVGMGNGSRGDPKMRNESEHAWGNAVDLPASDIYPQTDSGILLRVGDRVYGRNGFAFAGLHGTVVEIVGPYYVRVCWDHFSDRENHVLAVRPYAIESFER
jgi:hypothetical protein